MASERHFSPGERYFNAIGGVIEVQEVVTVSYDTGGEVARFLAVAYRFVGGRSSGPDFPGKLFVRDINLTHAWTKVPDDHPDWGVIA